MDPCLIRVPPSFEGARTMPDVCPFVPVSSGGGTVVKPRAKTYSLIKWIEV